MSGRLPAPTRRSTCRFVKSIPMGRGKLVDVSAVSSERAISFGPFRLLPGRRLLLEGDSTVRLGSRALDILIALAERAGDVVGKDELIARVWPGIFVEDSNLKFQVSALRRGLGDGRGGRRYIATVTGQGYSLIAPVEREAEPGAPLPAAPITRPHNLPRRLTRLIGRAETVDRLAARLSRQRALTIVGPGGIGKTSVALAVAELLMPDYGHGVRLIDLVPLGDPGLLPTTAAAALGIEIRSDNPLADLIAALRDRHMLIVLDNCEHVIGAAASFAVAVLSNARAVSILATSREPLRIAGEQVYRLSSLETPPISQTLSAAEALAFPAVELFVERATSTTEFESSDANARAVSEICRSLDGIPLAIELAAARVETFGARELAARLDDRLQLLTKGRRTALPRHRTLRATLDWSYELLSEPECAVLRRLAIFIGRFTLDAANGIAASSDLAAAEIPEILANLVGKSLVTANVEGVTAHYRLLETIRAYALAKLAESGERNEVARRHAEYYRRLFEQAEAEVETRPLAEWLDDYRLHIDNLRAALQWGFSLDGDQSVGLALTVASIPLWINLSMMAECRHHIERALARLELLPDRDLRREMELHAALGISLNYTTGPVSATEAAWTRTLEIAERLDDTEFQLRALRGLWAHHMNAGEYRRALAFAQRFRSLAENSADPADLHFGDRMAALMLHYLGDQESARRHLENILARPTVAMHPSQTARFLLDQDVTVQALLSRILWLQGFADQATRIAQLAVDKALAVRHALSLCHALAQAACPVALYTGDLAAAEGYVATLLDTAKELGLAGWIARSHCFQGVVSIMRDDFAVGLPLLHGALDELREVGAAPSYTAFLAVLARGLGRAGRISEGIAAIDQALSLAERYEEFWCLPELLRNKGELHLLQGSGDAVRAAEDCFQRALDCGARDGTLAWELRAAISLARLLRDQARSADARALLRPVYDRFTEGFGTADLQAAKRLIDALS
jgi:predicted ATPase/DNA-binding winged helix-turn-helix (wHTH) protein